uniref:EB domain-containing protein n=1 Tax=Heterorhabditis bacteriophora TaxID=37862 RepID=A0A1I7XD95_HETBA
MNGDAQECVAGPNMCAKGYECVTSLSGKKRICCSKEDNEMTTVGNNCLTEGGTVALRITSNKLHRGHMSALSELSIVTRF